MEAELHLLCGRSRCSDLSCLSHNDAWDFHQRGLSGGEIFIQGIFKKLIQIGLELANLLAMSVMLGIIADNLPKSTDLTILGFYIIIFLVLGTCACVVSVVYTCIAHKAETYLDYLQFLRDTRRLPPDWLYRISLIVPKAGTPLPSFGDFLNGEKRLAAQIASHFQTVCSH